MRQTPPYSVVISERARQMLGVHIRFLANVSPEAARKAKTGIMEAIRSLAVMPERFSFLNVEHIPQNKYRKMFAGKRYLILYQVKDQTVYVDGVVDCRQDYGWLIE